MNCNNCGTVNSPDSKSCIKCGNAMIVGQPAQPQMIVEPVQQQVIQSQTNVEYVQTIQQVVSSSPAVAQNINQQTVASNSEPMKYITYVINFLVKPFKTFKNEERKFENIKTAGIFSAIIAVAMMVINLLISMISSLFTKTLDTSTFQMKTTFDISGLKNLDYVNLIFKNLLIYAAIILAIAAVYYVATLIIKKTVNFSKILAATSSSMIPLVGLGMLLSPILGKIWTPLSIIVFVIGLIYSLIIFIALINDIVVLNDSDIKIKFNTICISILILVGGYISYKVVLSDITSSLGSLSSLFY